MYPSVFRIHLRAVLTALDGDGALHQIEQYGYGLLDAWPVGGGNYFVLGPDGDVHKREGFAKVFAEGVKVCPERGPPVYIEDDFGPCRTGALHSAQSGASGGLAAEPGSGHEQHLRIVESDGGDILRRHVHVGRIGTVVNERERVGGEDAQKSQPRQVLRIAYDIPGIDAFLRQGLLPQVTESIRQKHGWHFYHYGNAFARGGGEPGWYTFDHRPRFNNNYIGLRNRIAILSEAYSYATFEERVLATLYFVEEILNYVHEHADEVRQIVAAADAASVVGESLALRAAPERSAAPVDILMGAVVEEVHPLTGSPLLLRADTQYVVPMYEYGTFAPTLSERVPGAYLVPAELEDVQIRLGAHGVALEPAEATPVDAEGFRIDSIRTAERPFQGRNEQTLFGRYESTRVTPAPGDMWARADQPLGRLLFSLLEPQSDDGFANWGFLADRLEAGGVYPIARVPGG